MGRVSNLRRLVQESVKTAKHVAALPPALVAVRAILIDCKVTQSLPRRKEIQHLDAAITIFTDLPPVGNSYICSFFDFCCPASKSESHRKLGIAGGAIDRLVWIQAKPSACNAIPAM